MEHKPLLSIAIPTYNRAIYLKNLLDAIVIQATGVGGMIQVCISDNHSTDNTKNLVVGFQSKYPGLIHYGENEKNLGVDINLVKVMEMAQGEFVWLLGDDDVIVEGGLKKVVAFIKEHCNSTTGLIALANRSYFIDEKTGKEVVYSTTVDQTKPKAYPLARKEVVETSFPNGSFISILIYDSHFLKKTLREEKNLIKEALVSRDYVHTFLYRLMFLKYPQLGAMRLNEVIIDEQLHYYKFYIEDRFRLHYVAVKKLANALLSSGYADDYYQKLAGSQQKVAVKNVIFEMALMKAFNTFHYDSFFGCIGMFFQEADFFEALMFTAFFVTFFAMPSLILRILCKTFVRIRYKNWQQAWLGMVVVYSKMSQGQRR